MTDEHKKQVAGLEATIGELNDEAVKLRRDAADADTRCEGLKAQLAEKDEAIKAVNDKMAAMREDHVQKIRAAEEALKIEKHEHEVTNRALGGAQQSAEALAAELKTLKGE